MATIITVNGASSIQTRKPVASKAGKAKNLFCAIELRSNFLSPLNLVSQRWGNETGRRTGAGLRALVRARHAVPLGGDKNLVGRGVFF